MGSIPWKVTLIFLIGIVSYSCSDFDRNQLSLYSVDTLLQTQSKYLSERTAFLEKTTSLGLKHDTVKFSPKTKNEWINELEIFGILDILNKPASRDFYKVENYPDNKSNLKVKSFTATKELPVKYLRLYYQGTEEKVRMIEAKYTESNLLYGSNRMFTMKFQPIDDTFILTSFEVVGDQKMFLGDSVKYTISGAVSLSN